MLRPLFKRFNIPVTAANQTVSKTFELDKSIKVIKGVLVTSNRKDLLHQRGEQKIDINNYEYFGEDYQSQLLMCNLSTGADVRYTKLKDVSTGNGTIKIVYRDSDDGLTTFSPYTVMVYFDCEREDGL